MTPPALKLDDGTEVSGTTDKDGKAETELAGGGKVTLPDSTMAVTRYQHQKGLPLTRVVGGDTREANPPTIPVAPNTNVDVDARPFASDPPPAAGWWKIPEPVRTTLKRGFVDRMANEQNAGNNLDNAWYGGEEPKTAWEAVQCIGAQGLSIITRIHQRMTRVDPSGAAWEQIKYIRNLWWGGSGGFKVVYADRDVMRSHVRTRCHDVAEDLLLGSLSHQKQSSFKLFMTFKLANLTNPSAVPPDADTFREVDKLGEEALHFCLARTEPEPTTLDDIHLDWVSPVKGRHPLHRHCIYDWKVGAPHWIQATMHIGKPVFPFDEIGNRIASIQKRRTKGAKPKSKSTAGWDDWLGRWLGKKWDLAASGKSGHNEAMQWRTECQALTSDWEGG